MTASDDFITWVNSEQDYILEVKEILNTRILIDDATSAKEHLTIILAHRATLVTLSAKLHKFMSHASLDNLPEKQKGLSEQERKIILEKEVSDYEYWMIIVDGFVKTIDKQASACQTILSYEKNALNQLSE